MILVFAGHQHSPYDPGVHTLVGTCDSLIEAKEGVEQWWAKEQEEWTIILLRKHERQYVYDMVDRATCWYQIAEFVPATGLFTVLEEVKPDWRPHGVHS